MSTEGLDEYRANAACEDPARYLTREQAKAEIKVVFCAYAHEHADSTEAQECERTCPEHQSKFCSCTADLTDPRI